MECTMCSAIGVAIFTVIFVVVALVSFVID